MKKVIVLLLMISALFMITGCEKKLSPTNLGKKDKEYKLGDVVKSDITKFKLLEAKYTYALENSTGDLFGTAKEYDKDDDSRNPYVAKKGHTLVAITFSLENLDRAETEIDWNFLRVKYSGKMYKPDINYVARSYDNINYSSYNSTAILQLAGEKIYYRCYLDIDKEIKDLDETVDLKVELPTSGSSNKNFTYLITKSDRENYKGEEISLDAAVENFSNVMVQEYFKENSKDYTSVKEDELKKVIPDHEYNVCIKGSIGGTWTGTFRFESAGTIYEGGNKYARGYTNKRTWKIDKDNLILSWKNTRGETYSTTYEVKKVKDRTYLLLDSSNPGGILYKK